MSILKGLEAYFESVYEPNLVSSTLARLKELHFLGPESRIKIIGVFYHLLQILILKKKSAKIDSKYLDTSIVATCTEILNASDRSVIVGNEIQIFYLGSATKTPTHLITPDKQFKNQFFFAEFMKSFESHILKDSSFDVLVTLAKLLSTKENQLYFVDNFGLEFIRQLVLNNSVFLDNLVPAKSILLVLDSVLYHLTPAQAKFFYRLFFSVPFQQNLEFFYNFIADLVSLILLHYKLAINPTVFQTLCENKCYLQIYVILDNQRTWSSSRRTKEQARRKLFSGVSC
jgi:hypothetical protein